MFKKKKSVNNAQIKKIQKGIRDTHKGLWHITSGK